MKSTAKAATLAVSLLCVTLMTTHSSEAQSRRAFARGPNGSAGGFVRQGQYGQAAGGRAIVPGQGGAGFRGGSYSGPNGGSVQGANAWGYQEGVGGGRASAFQGTGPNGGSASGYSNNVYNAQTGTGQRNSGKQATASDGTSYGYNSTTDYAKGQGATTSVDTQNNGSYQVDWNKGTKPVVTQTSTTTTE